MACDSWLKPLGKEKPSAPFLFTGLGVFESCHPKSKLERNKSPKASQTIDQLSS
jgi:hypothetical protein